MSLKPFKIDVAPETLKWVMDRLKTARIIPDVEHPTGEEWDDGIPSSTVQELVDYWIKDYDWMKVQEKLNSTFKMFTAEIEEAGETLDIHFVHHKSSHPTAVPLLFCHGWPGNFTEAQSFLKLTEPKDTSQQAFHIVAPTIPGFVFSSAPKKANFSIERIAFVYHKLMQLLGYKHYVAQGGDFGSMISRSIAISFPEACVGVHINLLVALPPTLSQSPLTLLWLVLRWFTADEKARLARMRWWMAEESGYSNIQRSKPQTVSYALMDSPVGMLAWIRDKLEPIVDTDFVWEPEVVITWVMLYLLSGNSGHARIYRQSVKFLTDEVMKKTIPREVAFGASCFPKDVGYVPKWWAEASIAKNIVFWREHKKGGHFASIECGDVLIGDFLEFFGKISEPRRKVMVTPNV